MGLYVPENRKMQLFLPENAIIHSGKCKDVLGKAVLILAIDHSAQTLSRIRECAGL
jgi:hypothetical protein